VATTTVPAKIVTSKPVVERLTSRSRAISGSRPVGRNSLVTDTKIAPARVRRPTQGNGCSVGAAEVCEDKVKPISSLKRVDGEVFRWAHSHPAYDFTGSTVSLTCGLPSDPGPGPVEAGGSPQVNAASCLRVLHERSLRSEREALRCDGCARPRHRIRRTQPVGAFSR